VHWAARTPPTEASAATSTTLLVDATGLPLNIAVSGGNRHDSMLVEPLLDSMPAIKRGDRGHPSRRPVKLHGHGDKGYDIPRVRRYLRRRGLTARIARIGRDSSQRLGRHRWVVERTLGWLLSYKRLALRYDRAAVTIPRAGPTRGHPHLRPPATDQLTQRLVSRRRRRPLVAALARMRDPTPVGHIWGT